MTLLNCDVKLYRKKLLRRKIIAIAVFLAAVILNVLLAVFRTDATHAAFLAVIIIADIACGWFLIAWYSFGISLQSVMLRLASSDKGLTQTVEGVVTEVSEDTQIVKKLQSYGVTVENGGESRVVFVVKDGGIKVEEGKSYTITTVQNIATVA